MSNEFALFGNLYIIDKKLKILQYLKKKKKDLQYTLVS